MFTTALFYIISILSTVGCTVLGIKCRQNKGNKAIALSHTMLWAGAVNLAYMLSTLPFGQNWCSFFSSLYFSSVDVLLLALLTFTTAHTRLWNEQQVRKFLGIVTGIGVVDIISLLLNPFTGHAVDYIPRNTVIAPYEYGMHLPFILHLVFSYLLVVAALLMYIVKVFRTPTAYRSQYRISVFGIVAVVAINAVFLFVGSDIVIGELDYSVWCYGLVCIWLYWTSFQYTTHGMLNHLRAWVVESVGQGIALFDDNNELILSNSRIETMLGGYPLETGMNITDFIAICGLPESGGHGNKEFSIQTYIKNGENENPVQCDFRILHDRQGRVMGRLFVITDTTAERDILTGFHNWESFRTTTLSSTSCFAYPVVTAVCDINGLQEINDTMGRSAGDKAICRLADCMRDFFPEGTYFIRGREASLLALCYRTSEAEVGERLTSIAQHINAGNDSSLYLNIQYAMATADGESLNLPDAITAAFRSLQARKLMDNRSKSSAMLNSLIQALQESDADTEAHVARTQRLGDSLGRRLKLSDPQLSDLSLLCIMHDIGKIGIPLEILNKPSRLTADEWEVMKSHVEKGYQICKASQDLSGIADMVRHHHERWDGKGYPDGLNRESIPLLSRIISVVDSFDAMINNRVYRGAISVEAALEELRANAGTQFDPGIVAEFVRMIEENPPQSAEPVKSATPNPSRTYSSMPVINEADLEGQAHVFPVHHGRYVLDNDSRIIEIDEVFTRMTGYSQSDVNNGLYQLDLIPESDRSEYMMRLIAERQKNTFAFLEHRLLRKEGSSLYVFCFGRSYFDPVIHQPRTEILIFNSYESFAVQLLREDERNRAQARFKRWEEHFRSDSLTALLSHNAFRNDVDERLIEGGCVCMLIMMDVDHFKQYNDTYGHQAGDEFLISVANAIRGAIRSDDLACRMGGDEFAAALFLPSTVTDKEISDLASSLYRRINSVLISGTSLSMGCATNLSQHRIFNDLYKAADVALYQAKNGDRSHIVIEGNE